MIYSRYCPDLVSRSERNGAAIAEKTAAPLLRRDRREKY